MVDKNSLEFLPQVFRTNTNKRFLNATVDQLIQEPNMGRIYGYIGRQDLSPAFQQGDAYVQESDSYSQYYQLEPGLVINKRIVGTNNFKKDNAYNYVDLLNGIAQEGGINTNHSRLFANEYYNYEGFIDLDKLINYGKYYWVPNGPTTLEINGGGVPTYETFNISRPLDSGILSTTLINRNVGSVGYSIDTQPGVINPTITVARGGHYTFNLAQPGHPLYIQSEPGINTGSSYQENINVRQVYGVNGNGTEVGTITFSVPSKDSQAFFEEMPVFDTVDLVLDVPFNQLQDAYVTDFLLDGSLDGIKSVTSKRVVLINDQDDFWIDPVPYDEFGNPYDSGSYDASEIVPKEKRRGIWQLNNVEGVIKISYVKDWPANTKVFVREGRTYGHINVFKDTLLNIYPVPTLTAPLDTLYYQDGADANVYGVIKIVDPDPNSGLNINEILGQEEYTSPNGVKLTSGLKIKFNGLITPESYLDREFVVEGVGKSISLIPWDSLVTPDPNNPNLGDGFAADSQSYDSLNYDYSLNAPLRKDYIVINRGSTDGNAWSRTNRWFHEDVIRYSATFLDSEAAVALDNNYRAIRPIIEFDPNLQLWNHGQKLVDTVTVIDNYITDVANQVEGLNPYVLVYANRGNSIRKVVSKSSHINVKTLSFDSVTDLSIDMSVIGVNISTNTTIEAIDYNKKIVTISNPLVGEITLGSEITFNGDYVSDDIPLENGTKVIFIREKYGNVRNKVYEVKNILPHSGLPVTKSVTQFASIGDQILKFGTVNDLFVNMHLTGTNIPANTVVLSIDSTNRTVTVNNKISNDIGVGSAITFSNDLAQIHLTPLHTMEEGDSVVAISGLTRQNQTYWWHNEAWLRAQNKFSLNQSPLFDVFNLDGISWGNTDYYGSSTFAGSKLFGYKEGTGTRDSELGFPLTYRSIGNIGDIVFENYYDTDTFTFNYNNKDQILATRFGYVHEFNAMDRTFKLRNNWTKVADLSKQYIEKRFVASQNLRNNFTVDVAFVNSFNEKNCSVHVNGKEIITGDFYTLMGNSTSSVISFVNDLNVGDVLIIRIYGTPNAAKENFTLPKNLVDNSFNDTFETLTLGQIRNHLLEIASNSLKFQGEPSGLNNLRDIDYKIIPGKILQHSAGVHIAQAMFNNDSTNIIKAIDFSRRNYTRFKDRFFYLVSSMEFPDTDDARGCLDIVMEEITLNSSNDQSFYYSDMMPFGINTYVYNDYTVYDTAYRTFNLVNSFNITEPSYQAVLVYQNNQQLLIGIDYTVNGFVVKLTNELNLEINDVISIYEYTNTRGSMIPATPTKLGLYPKFTPQIYLDNTFVDEPLNVIQGHDGSKSIAFNDYRDTIILEMEKRIYNNISVEFKNDANTSYLGVEPGAFRKTDYSLDEWTQLLSGSYLNWAGSNNVNVFDNTTSDDSPFSFNYGAGYDVLFDEGIPGYWRGIYKYFYDTDTPHLTPWEMVGFSQEPTWWQVRYGPAPYSAGNLVLWQDMEAGVVYQHGYDSYTDIRYARPGLNQIIPVDEHGNLLAPYAGGDGFGIVTRWNSATSTAKWRFGDQSPQETAWRRSSEYPFAVQTAWALARPAQYCALSLNRRDLIRLNGLDQIINKVTANRKLNIQVTNDDYYVPGSNVWIRDRLADLNLDIVQNFVEIFDNLSLNLLYKASGYTDKSYVQLLADQASPSSTNSGIIVPQENYDIMVTKSAPIGVATYSAVVIEKTSNGFSVYGFDTSKPYFTVIPRRYNNNTYNIKVSNSTAVVYMDDDNSILTIPYGTQFTSKQQVVDFLISYSKYLTSIGFQFIDTTSVETVPNVADWQLSVREFLYWIEQGWDNKTLISLTPAGTKINFNSGFGVVDKINDSFNDSKVVDSNGKTLQTKDYTVFRSGTQFELKLRDVATGIHLIVMQVVQYEHTFVFDNVTVFNDVIYEPSLGNRQFRVRMSGFKTRDWDGSLYAPGFLVNFMPINNWQPMKDYYKGEIVDYKNIYYTARQFVPGNSKFDVNNWYIVPNDNNLLSKQLIPNLAFNAQQFENFYDVDKFDINRSADSAARNATGFVAREYLNDIGLDNISQHKFYLGMIREKGTQAAVNAFLRAKLPYLNNTVKIDEQWAIRLGNFGGYNQKKDIEISLAGAKTYNSSYIIELIEANDTRSESWNSYKPKDLLVKPAAFDTNIFSSNEEYAPMIPMAGHVVNSEVDVTIFDINKINNASSLVTVLGEGSRIWVASDTKNNWKVYRITADYKITIIGAVVVNNEIEFTTDVAHTLSRNDFIMIKRGSITSTASGNKDLSGFYRVNAVSGKKFRVPVYPNGTSASGAMTGELYVLKTVRFSDRSRFAINPPGRGWQNGDRVWIDGLDGNWEVLGNQSPWLNNYTLSPVFGTNSHLFGNGIDLKTTQDIMVVGAPGKDKGYVYVYEQMGDNTWSVANSVTPENSYTSQFGYSVKYNDLDLAVVGAPGSNSGAGFAYIMQTSSSAIQINQIINPTGLTSSSGFGTAVAASSDGNWVAISAPGTNNVLIYKYKKVTVPADKSYTLTKLIYGQPTHTIIPDLVGTGKIAADLRVTLNQAMLVPNIDYTVAEGPSGTEITLTFPTWQANTFYKIGDQFYYSPVTYNPTETHIWTVTAPFTSGATFSTTWTDPVTSTTATVMTQSLSTLTMTYDSYYEYKTTITLSNGTTSPKFGSSLSFATDGSQLIVGSPNYSPTATDVNVGQVNVYQRRIETFIANGVSKVFTLATSTTNPDVIVNGILLTTGYTFVSSTLTLDTAPTADSIITVATNAFNLIETKSPTVVQSYGYYGSKVLICPKSCSLYVGSPGYNNVNYGNGAVYRYVNEARTYGSIVGQNSNPTLTIGDYLRINNVKVAFTGTTVTQLVTDINNALIPGITASLLRGNLVLKSDSEIAFNKIIVDASSTTVLATLGLTIFKSSQIITSNADQDTVNFGNQIAINNDSTKLLISANVANNRTIITFDQGRTTFDSRSTKVLSIAYRSGCAYLYEYMGDATETAATPGAFTFAQTFNNSVLATNDYFGTGIALGKNWVMVSSLNSKNNNAGAVYTYLNSNGLDNWRVVRSKPANIDVRKLERLYLYNNNTKTLITDLPIIDPEHGMPVPSAPEQIRYMVNYDPAIYNNSPNNNTFANDSRNAWADEHVGELWWDTNQIKYADWNQGDLLNRFNNWGLSFPNSYISVYEWIESDVIPSQFATSKSTTIPVYTVSDVYTAKTKIDPLTLQAVTKYYFWVVNSNSNSSMKHRDTAVALQNLIVNPRNINQPFAAVIAGNALALFNCKDIVNEDTVLHISVNDNLTVNPVHREWSMFDDGTDLGVAEEFLNRMNDSMAGEDAQGRTVPDPGLTEKEKYGLDVRPRQTTFADRFKAREIWVNNVNAAFIKYPMAILRDLSDINDYDPLPMVDGIDIKLQVDYDTDLPYINKAFYTQGDKILVVNDSTTGGWCIRKLLPNPANTVENSWQVYQIQTYDLRKYWEYADWYATQYSKDTPVSKILNYEYEIANSNPEIGDVIKILAGTDGKWKLILVQENSLELIGQQNATIQFSSSLYSNSDAGFGFETISWEVTSYAKDAAIEFRKIFNTTNNYLLTNELRSEYKALIGTMIDNIATQFKQNDWLFKTSLINIRHNVRSLDQIPVYTKQPENVVSGFISEVKPYHTKIKQYVSIYDKTDTSLLDVVDFDLPAYYNSQLGKYRQPQLGNPFDDAVIDNVIYSPWIANHTYSIDYIDIATPGSGYNNETKILIMGDGVGATATAYVRGGQLYDIIITNPGKGYTYANIKVLGIGSGASAYVKLGRATARMISTKLNFDRFTYTQLTKDWAANTIYSINDIVLHNNTVYRIATGNKGRSGDQNVVLSVMDAVVSSSGTGYQPGDKLYVTSKDAQAETISLYNASLGTVADTTVFARAAFNVDAIKLASVTIQNGGSNYAVGNTIVFELDNDVNVVLSVTAISGGGAIGPITAVSIANAGKRTVVPAANPLKYDILTQGAAANQPTGYGATFNFVWGIRNVSIDNPGAFTSKTVNGISYTTVPNNPASTTTNSSAGTNAKLTLTYDVSSYISGDTFNLDYLIEYKTREWKPNTSYLKDTIIVYKKKPYVALCNFTSGRYFECNTDIAITNSVTWEANTYFVKGSVIVNDNTAYLVADNYTSPILFTNFVAQSTIPWTANTFFTEGQILKFAGISYKVLSDYTSAGSFDTNNLVELYENYIINVFPIAEYTGGYFDDASSRVWGYYQPAAGMPGKDLAQVMTGIDYPGVNVLGATFDQAPGYGFGLYEQIKYDTRTYDENGLLDIYGSQTLDTVLHSLYTDTQLGLRPADIISDGSQFIDVYNSHAPEELIPGHMFDSLNMRVKTLTATVVETAPKVLVISQYADNVTTKFYFDPALLSPPQPHTVLPVENIENVTVFSDFEGPRTQGVDYTVNWEARYIEFLNPPKTPSSIYISIYGNSGQRVVYNNEFISDGIQLEYVAEDVTLDVVQQAYVKVNNVLADNWTIVKNDTVADWLPVFSYSKDDYVQYEGITYRATENFTTDVEFNLTYLTAANKVVIRFDEAPEAGARIQIHLYDYPITQKAYSQILNKRSVVPVGYSGSALGYQIDLPEDQGFAYPREANMVVKLNGLTLEPSNQSYYTGTGMKTLFAMSATRNIANKLQVDLIVTVDGILKSQNLDYLVNNNGVATPTITFTTPPPLGSRIIISDRSTSKYIINDTNVLTIRPTVTLSPGDIIDIIQYSNYDQYQFNVQVFSGSLTDTVSDALGFEDIGFDQMGFDNELTNTLSSISFTVTRPVTNISNVEITLNGIVLQAYIDYYFVTPTVVRLDPGLSIVSDSIIVIRQVSEDHALPSLEYRIFKNIAETYDYIGIGASTTTVLTKDFAIDDEWMYVQDTTVFGRPDPSLAIPGILFLNGERITYYFVDTINKRLGQLRRGTNGTGAGDLYEKGTKVYDASAKNEIPMARDTYTITNPTINWKAETSIVKDSLISHDGLIYRSSMNFTPNTDFETTMTMFYQVTLLNTIKWTANRSFSAGTIISNSGVFYKVLNDFTSGASFSRTNLATALPWVANTAYVKNDLISYNGATYQAKASFTSRSTFEISIVVLTETGIATLLMNKQGTVVSLPPNSLVRQGKIWLNPGYAGVTDGNGLLASTSQQALFLKAL